MQKVIISILNYNNTRDTVACLDSILSLRIHKLVIETIVLDNGSKDKLVMNEDKYKSIGLKVLRNSENLGFSGGHNLVYDTVKTGNFDYFLLLNNDCILEKDSLERLVEILDKANIGAVVPKIYFTKGYEFHKERYREGEKGRVIWYAGGFFDWRNVMTKHRGVDDVDVGQYDNEEETGFATGACMLIKKEVIEKIGLFNEKYFLYFEDADFNIRIKRLGYKLLYQPNAVVWHNNAGSSGVGSSLHDYYLTRNRMLFGMEYAPPKVKLFLVKESIRLIFSGRKWQKIGIRDYYLNVFGKGSYK